MVSKSIKMVGPHSKFETGIWRTMRGELKSMDVIDNDHLRNLIPYSEMWQCRHTISLGSICPNPICNNMYKWLNAFKEEFIVRGLTNNADI